MAKDHPTGQSGLYEAFLQLKTPEQCYRFLQDVCSYAMGITPIEMAGAYAAIANEGKYIKPVSFSRVV